MKISNPSNFFLLKKKKEEINLYKIKFLRVWSNVKESPIFFLNPWRQKYQGIYQAPVETWSRVFPNCVFVASTDFRNTIMQESQYA